MKKLFTIISSALALLWLSPPAADAAVILRGHVASVSAVVGSCAGDGHLTAPSGTPQFAGILAAQLYPPPCATAGVDYRVGPSASQTFKLPTDSSAWGGNAAITYDATRHYLTCDASNNAVIDGLDMASGGGTLIIKAGCNNLTVKNSKLRGYWQTYGDGSFPYGCATPVLQNQGAVGLTFINVEIDGGGATGAANCDPSPTGDGETMQLNGSGAWNFDYVYIHDAIQHFVTFGGASHSKFVTGTISGTVMNVSAVNVLSPGNPDSGPIAIGDVLDGVAAVSTRITGNSSSGSTACAGSPCTGAGGTGTYAVSVSQTVSTPQQINLTPVVFSQPNVTHSVITGCGYSQGQHCNGLEWVGGQTNSSNIQWNFFYDPQPSLTDSSRSICYGPNTCTTNTVGGTATIASGQAVIKVNATNQVSYGRGMIATGSGFTGTAYLCGISDYLGPQVGPDYALLSLGTSAACTTPTTTTAGIGTIVVSNAYPFGIGQPIRYVNNGGAGTMTNGVLSNNTYYGAGPIPTSSYMIRCGSETNTTVDTLVANDNRWSPEPILGTFFDPGTGVCSNATGARNVNMHTNVPSTIP